MIDIIYFSNRKIDDASACFAIHWVNGAWGEISIGFFGDPATGPKSLALDGSLYRLKVQTFSVLCVTVWSLITTYVLLKLVDWTIGIRVSKEDELDSYDTEEVSSQPRKMSNYPTIISTISKVDNIDAMSKNFGATVATPLPQKYVMNSSLFDKGTTDNLNHRKAGNVNEAFERD